MESVTYTRAMLQERAHNKDTAANETRDHAIRKRVETIVAHIIQNVLRSAEGGQTHYLLDTSAHSKEHLRPMLYIRPRLEDRTFRRYEVNVLSEVIAQLQRLFPDCDILTNPLQTYVLVD